MPTQEECMSAAIREFVRSWHVRQEAQGRMRAECVPSDAQTLARRRA